MEPVPTRTFLLTWNPRRYDWGDLSQSAAALASGRVVNDRWTSGTRKDIQPGERVFLLRQGQEPRGILASGWATSTTFEGRHWEPGTEGTALFIYLRFDTLVDPHLEPEAVLRVIDLPAHLQSGVHWNTQSSGILIADALAEDLEVAWAKHVAAGRDLAEAISGVEGERRQQLTTHLRRERRLRQAAINEALREGDGHLKCEVPGCGFDFLEVYGELGKDYAQVHHLDPLGSRESPSKTAFDRLAIVCANCHAMIHRGGACRSLATLIPAR